MKPIQLTISAFGSYAKETCIDFKNHTSGVFLITGDTGSGKTTIFDALTYALYDETSGGNRDGGMMRSHYAASSDETYVQFTFEYKKDTYTIRRNPEYSIEKTYKNGKIATVKVASKVELILADNTPFLGKKVETDAKIVEIIGLTKKQFTQIVMIAQGDFLKLLYTKTEERKDIFSKIFHTEFYAKVQESLKQRAFDVSDQLLENERAIRQELEKVQFYKINSSSENQIEAKKSEDESKPLSVENPESEENQQSEEDSNLISEEAVYASYLDRKILPFEEITDFLENYMDSLHTKEIVEKESYTRFLEQWQKISLQFDQAKETNHLLEQKDQTKQRLEQTSAVYDTFLKEEQELEKQKDELLPKLIAFLADAEKSMGLFLKLEEIKEKEKSAQKVQKQRQNELNENKNGIGNLKEELLKLDEKIKEREQAPVLQVLASEEETKQQQIILDMKELALYYKKYQQQSEVVTRSGSDMLQKQEKAKHALTQYETHYSIFLTEQAGILAKDLKENMPCPVCGSTHHPALAQISHQEVTQSALEQEKEEADAQSKERETSVHYFQQQKEILKSNEEIMQKQSIRCLQKEIELTENTKNELNTLYSRQKELLEEVHKRKELYDIQKQELSDFLKDKQKKQTLLEQSEESAEDIQKQCYEANLAVADVQKEMELLIKALPEEEKEILQEKIKEAAQKRDFITRQYQEKKEKLQNMFASMQQLKGNFASLEKQCEHKQLQDMNLIAQQKEAVKEKLDFHQKNVTNINAAIQLNQQIFEAFSKYRKKFEKFQKEDAIVSALSKAANGRISGEIKLDLETYVQRQFFRQILVRANKRLSVMTRNQFILQLKEEQSSGKTKNEGLDMSVYSLVTDTTRDVKTLSGGEAFMAALSLALGLADIVQANAGSIHLDMMFIDEGFGSLDDASRDQAIEVLNELAEDNRLIGIISHVSELKERIDHKLLIEKTQKGSVAKWNEKC